MEGATRDFCVLPGFPGWLLFFLAFGGGCGRWWWGDTDVSIELKLKWPWALVSEETLASSEMEVELDIVATENNMEKMLLFCFLSPAAEMKRDQIVASGLHYPLISIPKASIGEEEKERQNMKRAGENKTHPCFIRILRRVGTGGRRSQYQRKGTTAGFVIWVASWREVLSYLQLCSLNEHTSDSVLLDHISDKK